ncbi:hypothetical protein H2248_011123 [Termitomyces sp. 'cryptogamus']|nr:hypothetical protein H2248_011123 [Termitomyces sp. 'cryptogamus']
MATTSSTNNPFRTHAASSPPNAAPSDSGALDEELPPAYTLTPDVQHGESTVQYGPQRPFQAAPPPVQLHSRPTLQSTPTPTVQQPHTPSVLQQIRNTITSAIDDVNTGSSWSTYPGRPTSGYEVGSSTNAPPLPPRPASTSPVSDFARDFYAAGPGSADSQQPHASTSASASPPISSVAPTTTPTPGRVLLRDGKMLVYPKDFLCHKCFNTGYKHSDPTHPCKKCWSKYSKPFSGPLAYAFSLPASHADSPLSSKSKWTSKTQTTFQRPLPDLLRSRWQRPQAPAPLPPTPLPFQPQHQRIPLPGGYGYTPAPTTCVYASGRRPPNAVVYTAGDPRLGGRPCWNCDGKGSVSLLFLGSEVCEVCSGVGRVWR